MTNQQIAHRFFYPKYEGERYYPRSFNCGFEDDTFYSYSTAIARIVTNKKGERVLLVSSYNMTNTTAGHITCILSANPQLSVYYVPFKYGSCDVRLSVLAGNFVCELARLARQKMTLKANRENFERCYNQAKAFSKDIYENANLIVELKKHADLYATISNDERVKELKSKCLKLENEKRKQEKATFNALIANKSICELARYAYEKYDPTNKQKQEVKKQLNPRGELALCWFDDEKQEFKSSKAIRMTANVGDVALKVWKSGKLKRGLKFDKYTILKVCADFIQIGCHKILTKNLEDLCKIRGI